MREHKFRGKRLDNGEWVYGDLISNKNRTAIHDQSGLNNVGKDFISLTALRVDPSTVGQYTGLKDKNGKEIYEGDLVAVVDYANWEGLYKIIWDKENLTYMLEDAFGDREKLCEFEEYLVKGNIYEIPELLD